MATPKVKVTIAGHQRFAFVEFPDDAGVAFFAEGGSFSHTFTLPEGSHRVLVRVNGMEGTSFTLDMSSSNASLELHNNQDSVIDLPLDEQTGETNAWELRYGTLIITAN